MKAKGTRKKDNANTETKLRTHTATDSGPRAPRNSDEVFIYIHGSEFALTPCNCLRAKSRRSKLN